ncbi:MAG: response regulator [Anaerolineales bacterium]|nr:response regulator [Anaerolineales bacterium]
MEAPSPRRIILVVEDNAEMRRSVASILELENYVVVQAENGQAALAILQRLTPDLILSDINMPRMSGIELYEALRQNPRWVVIPVIFLTAIDAPDEVRRGRLLGVEDYLTKPIDNADLLAVVNARLLRVAEVNIAQIGRAYLETVNVLANTIEGRDAYTHGHVERVATYARCLAEALGWAPEHLRVLEFGARLHDIGKIIVPDHILNKPDALTSAEWAAMRQHPVAGARILRAISHLQGAVPYVLYHHERWDGSGYPHSLRGKDIPIEGRLLAIADVYDALTTARPYRPARPPYEVLQYVQLNAGRQFDPHLAPVFLKAITSLGPRYLALPDAASQGTMPLSRQPSH